MSDLNVKIIGSLLKSARQSKGLTQKNVAEELNVSKIYISKIENGRASIGDKSLRKFLNLYGLKKRSFENALQTNSKANLHLVKDFDLLLLAIDAAYDDGRLTPEKLIQSIQHNYKPKYQ